jgi:hypothetical protein
MIAKHDYTFNFSVADVLTILEALRKLSEDKDMRKPYRDSINELTNRIKLEIREQEASE